MATAIMERTVLRAGEAALAPPRSRPGGRRPAPTLSGAVAGAAATVWSTLCCIVGPRPSEGTTRLVEDAVLARILIDRGVIDDGMASMAAADRDGSGLLLEHVLHASYGIPLDDLLGALAERREIMTDSRRGARTID